MKQNEGGAAQQAQSLAGPIGWRKVGLGYEWPTREGVLFMRSPNCYLLRKELNPSPDDK